MSSLKLVTTVTPENPVYHDLELSNGQFVFVGMDETDEADQRAMLRQRIECRLLLFKGEWFLDQNEGIPWHQKIFVKGVTVARINRIFKAAILQVEGVAGCIINDTSIDTAERSGSISFTAISDKGIAVDVASFSIPFNVKVGLTSND